MKQIPYTKPSITDLEVKYATDAAKNGWGEKCYDYIYTFEEKFKSYLGVDHSISTSSCTGALHMGLHALGITYGDEVILANTNWIATISPIIHLGATPVFVDICEDSLCIDANKIEQEITNNTKAIIAVHLYGNLCDMDLLLSIGEKYNIPIIEDSAEAVGSTFNGKYAGSMGHFGVFSFHGTKTITTGEGGMFVTNDSKLYENVLTLSNHGRSINEKKQFWPDRVGFKYKMSNIEAAIGVAQLERIDELIKMKRDIFINYKALLKNFPVYLNPENNTCTNGFWMPTFIYSGQQRFRRNDAIISLKEKGIDARVIFWPISKTSINGRFAENLELSESLHLRGLNLPSPFGITTEEQEQVVDALGPFIR